MKKKPAENIDNMKHENTYWNSGIHKIGCVDEVGRGPFAGPVVAAAVIMPAFLKLEGLTDSKKISKNKHHHYAELVRENAISFAIGIATVEEIDAINIKQATRLAMKRAVEQLEEIPELLLIDGNEEIVFQNDSKRRNIPQVAIVKGDLYSQGIAAASILAKVYRDDLMKELDNAYEGRYDWANNAGYQTNKHIEACKEYGLTPHHRKSWKTMELFR